MFIVTALVGDRKLPISTHETLWSAWDAADGISTKYNLRPMVLGMFSPYQRVINGKRVIVDVFECKSIEELVK